MTGFVLRPSPFFKNFNFNKKKNIISFFFVVELLLLLMKSLFLK